MAIHGIVTIDQHHQIYSLLKSDGMNSMGLLVRRLFLFGSLGFLSLIVACGGSGGGAGDAANSSGTSNEPTTGAITLKAPKLSFSDTGLSVSDGVTRNGLWAVDSDYSWEFSLDKGVTWTIGSGKSFEVKGDGPKMIWVRARDDAGNKSEIVVVTCVLDTMAPAPVAVSSSVDGFTRSLQVAGLEANAKWEYSLDNQISWHAGSGSALGTLGNGLSMVWIRQVDLAGNASASQVFDLQAAGSSMSHEASTNPLQPSKMADGLLTMLIHGVVVRGDADYVRWDTPKNHRIQSVRLIRYVSEDAIAFYAIQSSNVFDAGVDVSRMLVYGHMGPADLNRNVLANISPEKLGEGPMTIWFQQTGTLPTEYAIEIILQAVN
jgi:hypothetical protein